MVKRKTPDEASQVLATDKTFVDLNDSLEHRFNSELLDEPGGRLAAGLPESLTMNIDLPPESREIPADEAAVRIDDVPVAPSTLPGLLTGEIPLAESSEPEPAPVVPIEPTPTRSQLPRTRTGSAYDAVLGGHVPGTTGDYPRWTPSELARLATGEVPRTPVIEPSHRTDSVWITGEVPRVAPSESSRVEPATPAGGISVSRRDRMRGAHDEGPESSAMLTADRLIDQSKRTRPRPTGSWNKFVYGVTLGGVNLGDSPAERARKELDTRIQKTFEGGTRFVPVLTRKGGVGKTTITALMGMALATTREDRIIAVDANPDRGTLSERVNKQTRATVRDVVHRAASVNGFTDFTTLVSRDETRLDILASDTDPLLSEAFDENDYNVVADLAARFYSIMLTDCGTGIVHSVMRATLQRADSVVIVSGGSVDEARLASETLTWLEANGYGDLVRNAIVALNTATQGTNLVKLDEIEAHFKSRVRAIVRIPYDPILAAGSVVSYKDLKPGTKDAARQLAALVVDGLPTRRGA